MTKAVSEDPDAKSLVASVLGVVPHTNRTALAEPSIMASWAAPCITPSGAESVWAQKTVATLGGSLLDFEVAPEEANVPAPWGLLAMKSQPESRLSCWQSDARTRRDHQSCISMTCECGLVLGAGPVLCWRCGQRLSQDGPPGLTYETQGQGSWPMANSHYTVSPPQRSPAEVTSGAWAPQSQMNNDCAGLPWGPPPRAHASMRHLMGMPGSCHLSDVAQAEDGKTLLVQCIPPDFDQRRLLELWRYREYYLTMLWLPYLVKQRRHMGHAFLDFATPEAALRFWRLWENYTMSPNAQPLSISAASTRAVEESIEAFFGRELTGVLKSRRFQPAMFCPQGRLVFKPGVPPDELPLLSGAPRLPS